MLFVILLHDFLNLSHFEMGRVGEDGRRQRPSLQVGRVKPSNRGSEELASSRKHVLSQDAKYK